MKKIAKIILCIALSFMFVGNVYAEEPAEEKYRVYDIAEVMSVDDMIAVEQNIFAMTDAYNIDMAIVTMPSLEGTPIDEYAKSIFTELEMGVGEAKDGIVFLMDIELRDFYVYTNGLASDMFPDSLLADFEGEYLPYISDGDYVTGFNTLISLVGNGANEYISNGGKPANAGGGIETSTILIGFGIGIVLALIIMLILKAKMNTAKAQPLAHEYVKSDSFNLTSQRDMFLHSTVTRTAKPKNNSSSGGSGGRGGKF